MFLSKKKLFHNLKRFLRVTFVYKKNQFFLGKHLFVIFKKKSKIRSKIQVASPVARVSVDAPGD